MSFADVCLKRNAKLYDDDGIGGFIDEHKIRPLLSGKDFRRNGSASSFSGIGEITIDFPRMIFNVLESIHDLAKNGVMTPSI